MRWPRFSKQGEALVRRLVPEHEHVVLDETVFHALQDLSIASRMFLDSGEKVGQKSMRVALDKLDAALEETYDYAKRDPRHHIKLRKQVGLL